VEFDINNYLKSEVPDDTTIGECRAFICSLQWWKDFSEKITPVTLEFWSQTKQYPDDALMGEFRAAAQRDEAFIVLRGSDDGGGGPTPVPPKLVLT
jgi:hypothetical protein